MRIPRAPIDGAPSPRFGLSLLGRFELTGPDGVVDLPSKKLAGLLAYLACTAPQPQPRERLSALFWGSHFDAQAKQNLRQALFRLRQVLGQDVLESDGEAVSLNAGAVLCDVSRFKALAREGSRDALSAAADLYRGRLVDDVTVSEEGWNEWLTGERERLLELVLGVLVGLGEQELAAGRAEHALKAGQRAIALNNMREDAHRLIVQALAASGRKAEALKHYQDLVALLKDELNTEPDAATRSLVAELGRTQPPSTSPAVGEIAKPTLPQPAEPRSEVPPDAGTTEALERTVKAHRPAAASPAAPGRAASPERRQLTIMVCSMIGSTPHSGDLDPEEMSDRIAPFHKAVADVAARFDGFVAQYLGDGVLVYFGYPARMKTMPNGPCGRPCRRCSCRHAEGLIRGRAASARRHRHRPGCRRRAAWDRRHAAACCHRRDAELGGAAAGRGSSRARSLSRPARGGWWGGCSTAARSVPTS